MKQMLSNVIAAAFVAIAGAGLAHAEGEAVDIPHQDWTFSGPFGTWDEAQLQRGFVIFSRMFIVPQHEPRKVPPPIGYRPWRRAHRNDRVGTNHYRHRW